MFCCDEGANPMVSIEELQKMAVLFDMTIDQIVNYEGSIPEPVSVADKPELEKLRLIEQLDEDDKANLRAICRVFDVSLTWLQAFAQSLWSEVPKSLGLKKRMIKKVKKMEVFGLQSDERWSFVGKKACKRWIWIVFDPVHPVTVADHIGNRSDASARALWKKIPKRLRGCKFESDDWDSYKKIFPADKHRIGKAYTYFIEGFNATIRARCSRLVRKALSFSKSEK